MRQQHLLSVIMALPHAIRCRRVDVYSNLPLRLVRASLRLQQRYHAYPLLRSVSIVVYIFMTNANETAASLECDHGSPARHSVSESRRLQQSPTSPRQGIPSTTATVPRLS